MYSECLSVCDPEKMSAGECNEVGWLLATSEVRALRDVPRALEFAEAAVRREPDNRRYVNTLGAACYYAGRWDDARVNMLRCLELDAPNACDLFFLAMACWQLDQKDDARQWFNEAVARLHRNHQTQAAAARFRTEAESLLGIETGHDDR